MLLLILVGLFLAAVLWARACARPRFDRRPMKHGRSLMASGAG